MDITHLTQQKKSDIMYEVYYIDKLVFSIKHGQVRIYNEAYLPFDIYIEESNDFDDRLNNQTNFIAWCSGRILSIDREYMKEILNFYGFSQNVTDAERANIGIATRCLSLNDCYWVKKQGEPVAWKDVNLFQNSLENSVFEIALRGKSFTMSNSEIFSPELNTDGKAAKAWRREQDCFYLLKGDKNDSVRREVEASQILTELGISNVGYHIENFQGEPVSVCKCFTNPYINFAKAEWFDIWCMNHDISITDYLISYKTDFDKMNLADYLIGNSDEHAGNWGFLYNNNREILGLNPRMDYDHAFSEKQNLLCLPMRFFGQQITLEENAKNIIRQHPDWINFDIDLSKYKYGAYVTERLNILQNYIKTSQ